MPNTPRIIKLVSTKYDGELRDCYEGQLVEQQGTMLRVNVPAGTPIYDGRHDRFVDADTDATEIYFTDRWYNVLHHWQQKAYKFWYSNMSMPATFDGGTLRWVDLDIDVSRAVGGTIRVHDEDEFECNRVSFGYPVDVVGRVLAARDEVLRLAKANAFPFDHESHIRKV